MKVLAATLTADGARADLSPPAPASKSGPSAEVRAATSEVITLQETTLGRAYGFAIAAVSTGGISCFTRLALRNGVSAADWRFLSPGCCETAAEPEDEFVWASASAPTIAPMTARATRWASLRICMAQGLDTIARERHIFVLKKLRCERRP